jgi:hypothetical protein
VIYDNRILSYINILQRINTQVPKGVNAMRSVSNPSAATDAGFDIFAMVLNNERDFLSDTAESTDEH